MGRSLKEALISAGLKPASAENERPKVAPREVVQKSVKHQQTRNFCEICELIHPDVERYRHRNPTTSAEWICVACADKFQIYDECRQSHQSDFARKGMFRREFGPTKKFPKS